MKYQSLSMLLPVLVLSLPGAAVSAQTPEETAPPSQSYLQSQFDTIGVQHYDAGMMADLVTRQDAIVMVPPNFVIADNGPAVPPARGTAANSTAVNDPKANNRLPDGVQRIYALRADNSLVIQTTPGFQYRSSLTSPISQKGSTP